MTPPPFSDHASLSFVIIKSWIVYNERIVYLSSAISKNILSILQFQHELLWIKFSSDIRTEMGRGWKRTGMYIHKLYFNQNKIFLYLFVFLVSLSVMIYWFYIYKQIVISPSCYVEIDRYNMNNIFAFCK